ncbi:prepilin peptidase [Leuconostoc rapi]|uniref:prepilin peptidase n=1 Tax=Leuconostoc rapi TaxID=1406906 RepID=UPI00195DC77C|nr:A24 family peptidase [Leuconostoc rapi]MBM7435135.1 leader peptidase (prepilin peptidase)/N-methyltransferase [Leuconostoc rapi]
MENLLILILNAVLVSSIMCLADRINHGINVFIKQSFCWHCGHRLKWYDLIPVFATILTRGHCRYCQKKFGLHYAIFEFLGAFIGSCLFSNTIVWITAYLLFFLALEDWHNERIHSDILIPWFLYLFIQNWGEPKLLMTCMVLTISILLVYYRQALGAGDIPVLLVLTLISTTHLFALSLLIASIFGLVYLGIKQAKRLPFVPFLYIGWLVATLIEKTLINY